MKKTHPKSKDNISLKKPEHFSNIAPESHLKANTWGCKKQTETNQLT